MEWTAPFIVYRRDDNGKLFEVFHANDIQKAKYWLAYIAEIGDVLTKTPAHPKNKTDRPEYWSHKENSGESVTAKERWLQMHSIQNFESAMPTEQMNQAISG